MEDAAWSPYDSSFRSPYLAGDSARSEAVFPDMKINTRSGEYSFPWTSNAGLAVLVWWCGSAGGNFFSLPCLLNG